MHKTAQEEIKNIIDLTIKPVLKELDYRKKGNTWNLCDGELIKVVNVQLSSGNSSEKANFTINLGIYNQRFRQESLASGKMHKNNIKEYDCEIRERIGSVCGKNDTWWTVFADHKNEEVIKDLETKFIDFAVPWLASFKNLEDEYAYFAAWNIHHSAFIAAYVLKKESVLEHLRESMKDANPYYVKTLEKWMSQRGLTF
jgi:hypothetical protein